MKTVFEPSNALEGHMIQDLLKQRGIPSRVDGAQLQGAVGELPVTGFVRVVVDDEDYGAARAVINDWETASVPEPALVPADRSTRGFIVGLTGLAIGVVATYALLRTPVNRDHIDSNEDGRFDEHYSYSPSGALLEIEIDRNHDGRIDVRQRFDRQSRIDKVDADEDFNGSFETRWYYRANQPYVGEVDSDGDSLIDFRTLFRDGVAVYSEYLVAGSRRPTRVDHYRLGKLISAEVDTDRDGRLDKRYKYSELAEIIGTESIQTPD